MYDAVTRQQQRLHTIAVFTREASALVFGVEYLVRKTLTTHAFFPAGKRRGCWV